MEEMDLVEDFVEHNLVTNRYGRYGDTFGRNRVSHNDILKVVHGTKLQTHQEAKACIWMILS